MKLAPPLAAPDKILIFLFSEFKNPLIAGPGPTYAISTEFAKSDSITCGPLSKILLLISVSESIFSKKNPFSIPTMGITCPTFGKYAILRLFSFNFSFEFNTIAAIEPSIITAMPT